MADLNSVFIYKQIIDCVVLVDWLLNRNDVVYIYKVGQKINKFYNIVTKKSKNKLRSIHRSDFEEVFLEFASINFNVNA